MANYVKQLSIFLENRAGTLNEVFELLAAAKIRILASTLSDTTEYGILRLITDDNCAANDILSRHNRSLTVGEVLALEYDSTAEALGAILRQISEDHFAVGYMYCLSGSGRHFVVLRLSGEGDPLAMAERRGYKCLSNEELIQL